MKTYLLDSDILIDFFNQHRKAVQLVEELGHTGDLIISILSITELRSGWDDKKSAIYLPLLYDIAEVIPLTQEIAEKAGKYRYAYSKKGKPLGTVDMLLAATAIKYNYCLVTHNTKDYPLQGLDLYPNIYS